MLSALSEVIGKGSAIGIRQWVRLSGRYLARCEAPWLDCPMGTGERIGAEFYAALAERENLTIQRPPEAGLLASFEALRGPYFNPDMVRPEIRDFY